MNEKQTIWCTCDSHSSQDRTKDQAAVKNRLARNHGADPYTSSPPGPPSTLLQRILEAARADGAIADAEAILDYILPNDSEPALPGKDSYLTDYHFDIVPGLIFGSNLYLYGSFDASDERKATIGKFKTLRTDLEACRIMGALGGTLMYYGRNYVEREIHRYTRTKDLVQGLTQQGRDGMNAAAPSQHTQEDEVH